MLVPVCATEYMNYLIVISQKKHIIQTEQDKALLYPVTDYNYILKRSAKIVKKKKKVI